MLSESLAIIKRDISFGLLQRSMMLSGLVRSLLWMVVIGGGGSTLWKYSEINYQTYLFSGLLAMSLLFSGVMSCLIIVDDKEKGITQLFQLAPIPLWLLHGSRILAALIISLLQFMLVFLALIALPQVSPQFNWLLFIYATLLTGLFCCCLGFFLASISYRSINFSGIVNFIIFPLFFLSGSLFPISNMPIFLQKIIQYNPFAYAVHLLHISSHIVLDRDVLKPSIIVILSCILLLLLSKYYPKVMSKK